MPWRKNRDPLFRGDEGGGVSLPDPTAMLGIVEHVLYLGGAGRPTPFHSTSESEEAAKHFAGRSGRTYRTTAPKAESNGVVHISQVELKSVLRGKGQGRARWTSALEVMQARRYVEQWAEHLLDFSDIVPSDVPGAVGKIYER